MENSKPCSSDASKNGLIASYLTPFPLEARQRKRLQRKVFNTLCYVERSDCP